MKLKLVLIQLHTSKLYTSLFFLFSVLFIFASPVKAQSNLEYIAFK